MKFTVTHLMVLNTPRCSKGSIVILQMQTMAYNSDATITVIIYAQAVTLDPGIAGHQGTYDINTNNDPAALANNIFRDNGCSIADGELYNPAGNPISKYWHSLNNSGNSEFVVPVSGCYTTPTQVVLQLYNFTFEYSASCPDGPNLRPTASSNLSAIHRQFSLDELHFAEARLIAGGEIDTSALITKASLAADNVVRMYLADTALTHAYDSVYYFLTSLSRYNSYQAKCAALLTNPTSPVRQASLNLVLNSDHSNLFSLQEYIAAKPQIIRSYGYDQADSLIYAANDSTWFGNTSLRSWLRFNEIKEYPPVIIYPYPAFTDTSQRLTKENIINTIQQVLRCFLIPHQILFL